MTSLDLHGSQAANFDTEECTKFVLGEIEHSREMLAFFTKRFENLITLYMATLGAVLSATVVVLTSPQSSMIQRVSLALLGMGAWGFSTVIYTRLSITRAMMVSKVAEVRCAQEYFYERHAELRRYFRTYSYDTPTVDVWAWWRSRGFSRQTIGLFVASALFIALMACVTSILIMGIIFEYLGILFWRQSAFHIRWYLTGGIAAFGSAFLLNLIILRWQLKQADKYAKRNLVKVFGLKVESSQGCRVGAQVAVGGVDAHLLPLLNR